MDDENSVAKAVHALEKFTVLYSKIIRKMKEKEISTLDPAELCVIRWAAHKGIERQEVLRRTGWGEQFASPKLSRLIAEGLIRSEACDSDRRKHLLRAGPRTRRFLKLMDKFYVKAFRLVAPDLVPHARNLASTWTNGARMIQKPSAGRKSTRRYQEDRESMSLFSDTEHETADETSSEAKPPQSVAE